MVYAHKNGQLTNTGYKKCRVVTWETTKTMDGQDM